jgi:TolA-binding protein
MELDCQKFDESLVEFVYGELETPEAFERHLRACPKCAALASEIRGTRAMLSKLAMIEPPALKDDDAVLAAAMARADEMAASAARVAAAGTRGGPTFLERLRGLFGAAAFRPAVGTAITVVLVAGVGLVFLADRPDSASDDGLGRGEGLTRVPAEEIRTARPAAPAVPAAAPVEGATPAGPDVAEPAAPPSRLAEAAGEAGTPPRSLERAAAAAAEPTKRAASGEHPEAARATGLELAEAPRPAPSRARLGMEEAVVVEAERIAALRPGAEGAPATVAGEDESALALDEPRPVIATPPPPGVTGDGAARQAAPAARPQEPTAPPAGPSAVPGAGSGPVRVPTPGQARYDSGMEAFRSGQYRDAADELDAFVQSPSAPSHLMPSGMHHLAMSQRRVGNLTAAARTYDQLIRAYQGYQRMPQAMLEAAQVNADLGRWARAEELLRRLSSEPGWAARAQAELSRLEGRRASRAEGQAPAAVDSAEGRGAVEAAVEAAAEAPSGD